MILPRGGQSGAVKMNPKTFSAVVFLPPSWNSRLPLDPKHYYFLKRGQERKRKQNTLFNVDLSKFRSLFIIPLEKLY